jgi:ABC-type histidine transport system ATPase subunit
MAAPNAQDQCRYASKAQVRHIRRKMGMVFRTSTGFRT